MVFDFVTYGPVGVLVWGRLTRNLGGETIAEGAATEDPEQTYSASIDIDPPLEDSVGEDDYYNYEVRVVSALTPEAFEEAQSDPDTELVNGFYNYVVDGEWQPDIVPDPEEESDENTSTITLRVPDSDEPTSIVLTSITRLDTNTAVTLPSPPNFVYDEGTDLWTISFTEPEPGLYYAWKAAATFADGTTSDVASYLKGNVGTLEGKYWTWEAIKNILGTNNATVRSQLDNGVAKADFDRIRADGTLADAYTEMRARFFGVETPLTRGNYENFDVACDATSLNASYKVARHRAWFKAPPDERDNLINLQGEAMRLLEELFGPPPKGIPTDEDDGTHPAGTFESVPLTFNDDGGVVDEYSGIL